MNIENLTFGVEIETTIPIAAGVLVGAYHNGAAVAGSARKTDGAPVAVPNFNGRCWKAERDSSIQIEARGHQACEFVSPILQGEAGVIHLLDFVTFLNDIGARVNHSCGLHVHIGLAPFSATPESQARFVKILSRLVSRNSRALYAQTGSRTREMQGGFCVPIGAQFRQAVTSAARRKAADLAGMNTHRYHILNLTNISTRRTVEFRCFAGTTDIARIGAHLLSVFTLVLVAAGRKSITAWDPAEAQQLTGVRAVHNLLKVRPVFEVVGSPTLAAYREGILKAAVEMAAQYDQARAIPAVASVPAVTARPRRRRVSILAAAAANAQALNVPIA
jgi:hypothetical protein